MSTPLNKVFYDFAEKQMVEFFTPSGNFKFWLKLAKNPFFKKIVFVFKNIIKYFSPNNPSFP